MSWLYQPLSEQTSQTGIIEADGSSVGTSTVAVIACAFALTLGGVTGTGASSVVGVAITKTDGAAAGSGSVDSNSALVLPSVFGATGTSIVNGVPVGLDSDANAAGVAIVNADSFIVTIIVADGAAASVSGVDGISGFLNGTIANATGVSTANTDSIIVAVATRGNANGIATGDASSRVIAGSAGISNGTSSVTAVSPSSLIPQSFKPIEQRRIRLPKLPRGLPPQQWIDIATREFDSFFNDLHHYLASNTFVNGVHTEILGQNFTLTPETSTIFVTANEAVVSDPLTAIKNVTNVPRYFTIVNTGLFPITLKDDANTRFGGDDIILGSGRIITLIYTGEAWVGNAI